MSNLPPRLQLLTLKEAAGVLRISVKTLQRRIAAGHVSAIRDGHTVLVPLTEIERYIADHRTA